MTVKKRARKAAGTVRETAGGDDFAGPKVQATLNLPGELVAWLDAVAEALGKLNTERKGARYE